MDVLELADEIIALTADIRRHADLSADEVDAARKETIKVGVRYGLSPEVAARLADDTQHALGAFADSLVAAREAAEAVKAVADSHEREIQELIRRTSRNRLKRTSPKH